MEGNLRQRAEKAGLDYNELWQIAKQRTGVAMDAYWKDLDAATRKQLAADVDVQIKNVEEEQGDETTAIAESMPATTLPASLAQLVPELQIVEYWSRRAHEANILPRGTNIAQAAVMIQAGKDLGFSPAQALDVFFFCNGHMGMKISGMLAAARRVGVTIDKIQDDGNTCTVVLRRGEERITTSFGIDDAEQAELVNKDNWIKYPETMRRWRALGDCLRIIASDATMGLYTREEILSFTEPNNREVLKEINGFTDNVTGMSHEASVEAEGGEVPVDDPEESPAEAQAEYEAT